jgi:hypothetical protein
MRCLLACVALMLSLLTSCFPVDLATSSAIGPPPVIIVNTSTDAQSDAAFAAARRQDTVRAYQDFLYDRSPQDKNYDAAMQRLDELLHPGGAVSTEWPPRR